MSQQIKKIILEKKVDNVVSMIYPKTSADIVEYNSTTVADELASLANLIESITADNGTIDTKIKEESDALYNKIMGLTDEDTTISEAYDTLKEVAKWINEHGDIVTEFSTDISSIKETLGNNSYTDEDGDHSGTGLLKEVETIKSTINNLSSNPVIMVPTEGINEEDTEEDKLYFIEL